MHRKKIEQVNLYTFFSIFLLERDYYVRMYYNFSCFLKQMSRVLLLLQSIKERTEGIMAVGQVVQALQVATPLQVVICYIVIYIMVNLLFMMVLLILLCG